MAANEFRVEGRLFRTSADYKAALRDKALIDQLKAEYEFPNPSKIKLLNKKLQSGSVCFETLVGSDFAEDVEELARKSRESDFGEKKKAQGLKGKKPKAVKGGNKKPVLLSDYDESMQKQIRLELKKQERRRKLMIAVCVMLAIGCFAYIGLYYFQDARTNLRNQVLADLKTELGNNPASEEQDSVVIHYDDKINPEDLEILEEYKILYNKNKKLIGWLKIDDTNIDYPVMQTVDNEYYLRHNINQEYDRNGSIFLDKDCDFVNRSTNLIVYGHHMKSGNMFGKLDLYSDQDYYEEHKYINFDTIYEKGVYEIMYVFRSRIYAEDEIVFKYYQFINANSETEFNSYMKEMAAMSLYDTGVTAEYGDELLTLSTCDNYTDYGRFVVVAKKVQ